MIRISDFCFRYGQEKPYVLDHLNLDVKEGEWVAFLTAEDYLQIAINWGDARKELGCKEGDEVVIEPAEIKAD